MNERDVVDLQQSIMATSISKKYHVDSMLHKVQKETKSARYVQE